MCLHPQVVCLDDKLLHKASRLRLILVLLKMSVPIWQEPHVLLSPTCSGNTECQEFPIVDLELRGANQD